MLPFSLVSFQVKCGHKLYYKTRRSQMSFAEIAEVSFQNGPKWCRGFAPVAKFSILFGLFLTYFGTCSVYTVIVAKNFEQVNIFWKIVVHYFYKSVLISLIGLKSLDRNWSFATHAHLLFTHTLDFALMDTQLEIFGTRFYDCQCFHGFGSGHYLLLFGTGFTLHWNQKLFPNVNTAGILLDNHFRHGSHWCCYAIGK